MKSKVTLITILLVFCFVLIPLLMSCNHTSGAAYIKEAGFKEQQHSLAINNPVLTAGKFHCLDITLTDDAQRISIVAYKGDVIPDVQNRTIKNYYRWEYDNGRWLDKSGYESSYIRSSQCKKNGHTYSFYIGLDGRADTGDWTIKISVDNKDVYSSPLNVETIHFNILLFTIYTNGFKLDRNDLPEFFKKHRKINHQEQTAANKESLDDIEASIDHFPGARSSVSQIKAFAIPVKKTPLYDELVDKLIKEPPSVQETDDDEEIENCYEAEKTIVVDPHLKVSTKKGVIPPPTRKINHLSFFSVGVAFLMAFLLFSLAFMPLITSLDVSIDSNSPVISSFTLSLDEVVNGDTIFLNVSTYNSVGISSVTADMGGIETMQLSLIDNSTSDHLWQAVWTVHDANPGDYFTTITALDNESNSYSAQLEWTVLSQDSDEEGGSDTNQTETTNEEDSNTTTDVSDFENEINSGNDTLTNETDGSILNETFNVENESSNETVVSTGLSIVLEVDKDVYFVNETVSIDGTVSYNDSLMNASVTLVVVGPGVNDSVVLNATMDGFRYEFVPVVAGEHVVVVNVSYENLTASNETRFIVEGILDFPFGGGDDGSSSDADAEFEPFHYDVLELPPELEEEMEKGELVRVIIRFKEGDSQGSFIEKTSFLETAGFVKTAEIDSEDFVAGFMDSAIFEHIKHSGDVEAVYPDDNFEVLLDESLPLIRFDEAVEEFGVTGSGKRICILDTGVDSSLVNYSYGYDFVNDDPIPDDEYGHGTKVASVIKSIAPDAELVVAKVINGSGVGYESDVLEALEWCIAQDPDVISFSIGSSGSCDGFCDTDFVANMSNDAVDGGIFVVAAAGNDGSSNLKSPACGSKVFSVGATDDSDNIASFSNVNPILDMFAPGVDIETSVGGGSGTSFSAPFVAGTALLVLENENLIPVDLKYRLRSTGLPINYTYNESLSLDISRLDIYNALANNKTMEPFDYSWWWQGVLGDGEGYEPAETETYYYDEYAEEELEWETNPAYMVDNILGNYAETTDDRDLQLLTGNTCTGEDLGTITMVEIQAYGYVAPEAEDVALNGGNCDFTTSPAWGTWIEVEVFETWQAVVEYFIEVIPVMCDPENPVYCSKVQIRVTYTPPPTNNAPTQSAQKIWNSTTAVEKNLNATDVDLYPTSFNVTINDADGDNMNITILTNESGTWTVVNQTSGSGLSNDTYSYTNTSWVDTYNTKYWISFNVTDGTEWCNETYNFTTNYAPTQTGESPTNQSTGISLTPQLYVICNDADGGDTLTATWSSNSSGTWYDFATNNSISPGTNITQPNANFSAYSMKYYWKVNLTDGTDWNNATYHFTTLANMPPEIGIPSVDNSTVGYGYNVTINVSVWDNTTGVSQVKCNVTYPDSTSYNFTMANTGGAYYEKEINLTDTWQLDWHNYTIWATDGTLGNTSSQYSFNVSAQCNVTVQTEKDSYGANEYVNLTDPPETIGDNPVGEGPVDNTEDLGYEFLDDNSVLHIWNRYNDYYFDMSNGLRFSNHYQEYWTQNVLMLGYYDGDEWNLIYQTDELNGFTKNITGETDNYINTTLWKNLSYGNYDFRLTVRYHLGVNDSDLTIIPYIKNLGQAIPYVLGFGWEMKDIQIDDTPEYDYINVNKTSYYLNQTLNNTYTNLSEPIYCWNELANETQICGYTDPMFYLMENITDTSNKSLYLIWNKDLDYVLRVKNRTGQYNAPVTLFLKIGTLNAGQEKYTTMHWLDSPDSVNLLPDAVGTTQEWALKPGEGEVPHHTMVNDPVGSPDGDDTYVFEVTVNDIEEFNHGTSPLLVGAEIHNVAVTWGAKKVVSGMPGTGAINLGIKIGGTRYDTGVSAPLTTSYDNYTADWAYNPDGGTPTTNWTKSDIDDLQSSVKCAAADGASVRVTQVYITVTYTPPNKAPTQSNQKIWNSTTSTEWDLNATDVSLTPTCFNVTINDLDSDNMNITIMTNESGSWTVVNQTSGSGLSNGTYSYYNTSWIASGNTTYYISFNLTDGIDWTNETYNFTTELGYIQSKIDNVGTTDCKGYLLIQIHYNDSGSWYTVESTIDETGTRTINASEYLKLDAIFNGTVYTSTNLTNGTGQYRVYVAFRDKFGSVLKNDDDAYMNASYAFNYTAAVPTNVAPVINSYNLSNSTGSKLNSLTGLLDVNNEYNFTVNITDADGWANIQYVNITAQYDNGSESTTYNQSNNSGGNLNMFLQYENTTGTASYTMLWPDDEVELISGNCSETIINSTTRVINISFKPKNQVRYANTTGGWATTQNATNDLNSWNFNITVVDNSSAEAWKINEYGVYKYTFIEPNQNWVDVTAAPGRNDTSSIVAVNYSSNYDFNMTIWFTGNLTNQTKGTTILIANNVDILNNTDPNDDIDTGDITFNGIGEANAVDIFNTSGTFPKNNASQTVDVQFNVRIPIGTMWGVYTVHINVKIFQKT